MTPIAVFAYRRPDRLDAVMSALTRCTRLDECMMHIFCDGPRGNADAEDVQATQQLARTWIARVGGTLSARSTNAGLARSISQGITALSEAHGRVIVVEDDLYVSPDFLDFMLRGLDAYGADERVYQISGFMYPIRYQPAVPAYFLPFVTSWGWATWYRAWKQYDFDMAGSQTLLGDARLRRRFDLDGSYPFSAAARSQQDGHDSTWDIQWYWTLFRANGLTLYPARSLVWNGDLLSGGTHQGVVNHSPEPRAAFDAVRLPARYDLPTQICIDATAYSEFRRYLRRLRRREAPTTQARIRSATSRLARKIRGAGA